MNNGILKFWSCAVLCFSFQLFVCANVQLSNENVQSPVTNSVDIPNTPSAPSLQPLVVTSPEPTVEEPTVEEEVVVDGQGNLSNVAVDQILSGGVSAENALTVFAEAKNLDLRSSSDIDQIIQAIELGSAITPDVSSTVVVAVTSAVTSNFLEIDVSSNETFSSESVVLAVQEATSAIASSTKLTSLLSVSSAAEVKESILTLALKVLEENGVSGDDLEAVVKQVEAIISELDNQVTKTPTFPVIVA